MPKSPSSKSSRRFFNFRWKLRKSAQEEIEAMPVENPTESLSDEEKFPQIQAPETQYVPGMHNDEIEWAPQIQAPETQYVPGMHNDAHWVEERSQLYYAAEAMNMTVDEYIETYTPGIYENVDDVVFKSVTASDIEIVNDPENEKSPYDSDELDEPGADVIPGVTDDQGNLLPPEYGEPTSEFLDERGFGADYAAEIDELMERFDNESDSNLSSLNSALKAETLQGKLDSGETVNRIPSNSGVLHTAIPQAGISWMQTGAEMRVAHNNAAIRLGPDMPHDELSGYGRKGAQHCDTIDLCAGFGQAENDGQGYEHGTIAKNNIITDAARVYISAMTDIDDNFGLATGTVGKSVGASGIGIKADAVRIVGRQGIKIVTGKMRGTSETASNGASLGTRAGIDLIAGNYTGTRKLKLPGGDTTQLRALQPAVMGDNLVAALEDIEDHVDDLRVALLAQSMSSTLCLAAMGTVFATNPFTAAAVAPVSSAVRKNITDVITPMYALFIKQIFWKWKFMHARADRYVCSRNVRLT